VSYTNKNTGETSIKYTRDGEFTVDRNGYLRTTDGDYVLNQFGALNSNNAAGNYIRIDPNTDYTVGYDGTIYQNNQAVGQIGLVDFTDYNYLSKDGDNYYTLVEGGTLQAADGSIKQGILETSNVNVVDEMVNMITIQRAYEAGQKMIQTEDSTLDKAVNQVGRV